MKDSKDLYSHPFLLTIPKLFFPGHIYYGPRALGFLRTIEEEILIVASNSVWQKNSDKLIVNLNSKDPDVFLVKREPDLAVKNDFEKKIQSKNYKYVIGFGGGSAMDVAKVAAFHDAKVILVPTTAGSGSEVSRYVLFINDQKEKEPITDSRLLPDTVLYDPSFLISLSPSLTAQTTVDAYTHALEGLTSRLSNTMSDFFALEALKLIIDFGPKAYLEPENLEARSRLQIAGFLAGLVQSSASVGLVHALVDFFGPRFNLLHSLAIAVFLPPVIKLNLKRSQEYYKKLRGVFTPNIYELTENLFSQMGLRESVEKVGNKVISFSELAAFIKKDPAAKTHQFMPTEEELKEILEYLSIKYG